MAVLSTVANVATPGLPVGSIQAFAGANAPAGWLLCDGSAVTRGNYPDLYNTIGNTYGSGDGSTTFNLPDLRGRVPAGKDDMGGTAASRLTSAVSGVSGTALGGSGGSQNIPDHSHQSYIRLFEYYNDAILGQSGASGAGGYNARTGAWTTWQHPTTTIGGIMVNDYTGRSTPASTWVSQTNMISEGPSYQQTPQNVQPTLVVNYIIKATADIARGGWYTQSSPPVVTQLPSNPAIGEECYLYVTSPYAGYQHQRYDGSAWHILADSRSKVWQSFTPGIANITIGNGAITGRYSVDGKVVNYIGQLNWGSTTSASGYFVVSLPTNAFGSLITGSVIMIDGGTRAWTGSCAPWSAGQFYIVHTESGNFGGVNQSNPFTWGSGDYFTWNLTYEIA